MYDTHHLRVNLEVPDDTGPLDPEVCGLAVHAVRELLFNVVKHAQVTEAYVIVTSPEPGWVRVRVRDAGVGFSPQPDRSPVGLGLAGMQRRIRSLGGRLGLSAAPGVGVEAVLDLPTSPHAVPAPPATPLPVLGRPPSLAPPPEPA